MSWGLILMAVSSIYGFTAFKFFHNRLEDVLLQLKSNLKWGLDLPIRWARNSGPLQFPIFLLLTCVVLFVPIIAHKDHTELSLALAIPYMFAVAWYFFIMTYVFAYLMYLTLAFPLWLMLELSNRLFVSIVSGIGFCLGLIGFAYDFMRES